MFFSHKQNTKENTCAGFNTHLKEIIRFLINILRKCLIKFINFEINDEINVDGFKDELTYKMYI